MVEGWNSGWGKLIADARDGRSQAWLADETGIDASLISRYEREEVSLAYCKGSPWTTCISAGTTR